MMKVKQTEYSKLLDVLQGDPFWDNLAEGQWFVQWTNEPQHTYAEMVKVTTVESDRQRFCGEVITVTKSGIIPLRFWGDRRTTARFMPLPSHYYYEVSKMRKNARNKVQDLLLRVKHSIPLLPTGNTCFVLHNKLMSVHVGRVDYAITDNNTRFRPSRTSPIHESYVQTEVIEMEPFMSSRGKVDMSVHDLYTKSVYYVSPRAYAEARRIFDNLNKEALQLLTPRYRPVCKDGLWGFEDVEMGIALPCLWAAVTPFLNGYASVMNTHGDWGLINMYGDLSVPCEWAYLEFRDDFTAIARDHEGHEHHLLWNGSDLQHL